MSDNKLLAENTIRRFMKLANVESMTDNFVNEKYGMEKKYDDEELKEEEEFEGGEIEFESVDQIVIQQLETIESKAVEKEKLINIYQSIEIE